MFIFYILNGNFTFLKKGKQVMSYDFDLIGDKQGVIKLLVLSTSLGLGN